MPRVKYLGNGFRILAVSGVGVIRLTPGEVTFVEDRVAYRMLEANSTGRKPLYEFLDQFPPVQKEETLNIKTEVVLPEPPEGLLPPSPRKFPGAYKELLEKKAKNPTKTIPKTRAKQPDVLARGK